jgi:hypothetical protein
MPEEDVAQATEIEAGAADSGAAEGGGTTTPDAVGGESQGSPSYVTSDAFQEAMGSVASEFQQHFDSFNHQLQSLTNQLGTLNRQRTAQRQPKPPAIPELPDFHNIMAEGNSYEMRKILAERDAHYQQLIERNARRTEAVENRMRRDEMERRYLEYFQGQTNSAAKQFPMFQDPKARNYLEHQVAAVVANCGGDIRRVNVLQIAKELNDWTQAMKSAALTEKTGGMPTPGIEPGAGGETTSPGAPPKGTASKPRLKDFDASTIKDEADLDKAVEEFMPQIEEMRAAEEGWEE